MAYIKKYKPSDPYKRLLRAIMESESEIEHITWKLQNKEFVESICQALEESKKHKTWRINL